MHKIGKGLLKLSLADLVCIISTGIIFAVVMFLSSPDKQLLILTLIGILSLLIIWTYFGDIITLLLIWFITVACLSYFYWRSPIHIAGTSINLTIDRLFILAIVIASIISLFTGTLPYKRLPQLAKIYLVMLIYFSVSLLLTGFRSISEVTPHFRLIGGYYFPFIAMIISYLAINDEVQIRKVSLFFFLFSIYLTFTAWAEKLHLWMFVFPRYIANPELGIHWGRARGPFLVSASLGITLVFCFFNNLYLAARSRASIRTLVYITNIFMVPAIFFTYTRSVWLAMIVCSVMWVLLSYRIKNRAAIVSIITIALILAVAIFHSNLISEERTKGGWGEMEPIYARIGLAKITWRIFTEHTFFGIGFGHFRDYAAKLSQDPLNKYIRFGSRLIEHNNFLSILAETGIIGLILYLAVLYGIYKKSTRLYRRIPPQAAGWVSKDLIILFWILLIDYLIDGMFRETSVDPFNNSLLFVFVGLILAIDYLLDYSPPVPMQTDQQNQLR